MQARGRRTRPEGEHRGRDGRVRYAARRRRDSGYRQRRAGRLARSLSGGRIETSDRHAPVLLLGSGLTAVDALLALRHHWHCGKVYMVSRRGLLPQTHVLPVDSIRPETNRDRQALSFAEQRRFLRHLRPLWDTHSHRMAPQIGTVVHGSLRDGSLEVLAGRTYGLRPVQDGVEVSIAIRGCAIWWSKAGCSPVHTGWAHWPDESGRPLTGVRGMAAAALRTGPAALGDAAGIHRHSRDPRASPEARGSPDAGGQGIVEGQARRPVPPKPQPCARRPRRPLE